VHALLEKLPQVESFRSGGLGEGGWGATLVFLKSLD
jgi:dsDNA-specific endonuclease/ATPase MutS2